MNDFMQVYEFHRKFSLPCGVMSEPMTKDKADFRLGFLYEEANEYVDAWDEDNLVKVADSLFDLVYVAIGTALFIGVPLSFRWTSFTDCRNSMARYVLAPVPAMLSPGLHFYFKALLRDRVKLFELAHDAAVKGEQNALEISIVNLRQIVNICHSMASLMDLPWDKCFGYVHQANMRKQRAASDGSDSKRNNAWDVIKPVGWAAPDALIAKALLERGWNPKNGIDINYATGKVILLTATA